MSAEKFFKEHSLEEISKKTKISPISLRLIRNKEFDKLPKVKFLGFIKIIEKTYNVDLSDLLSEYDVKPTKPVQNTNPHIKKKEKQNNTSSTFLITFFAFILIILGGILLFNSLNSKQNKIPKQNLKKEILTPKITVTKKIKPKETNTSLTQTVTKNISITKKVIKKYPITIIPNKLLWFKATNIDTNKSIQSLTSHIKTLPKGNYYIKFGHGDFNLTYNNQIISPKTKKVIRILFKNGKYKFMKKPNRFEK